MQRHAVPPGKGWWWKLVGGGRRTRTFEVIRRLIYSQLPLPLGTLPRSTASEPIRRNGGNKAMDDVKTGRRWRAPGWRVYDGRAMPKSTNGGPLIRPFRPEIAIIRDP